MADSKISSRGEFGSRIESTEKNRKRFGVANGAISRHFADNASKGQEKMSVISTSALAHWSSLKSLVTTGFYFILVAMDVRGCHP